MISGLAVDVTGSVTGRRKEKIQIEGNTGLTSGKFIIYAKF
jgi:hypothetical protein